MIVHIWASLVADWPNYSSVIYNTKTIHSRVEWLVHPILFVFIFFIHIFHISHTIIIHVREKTEIEKNKIKICVSSEGCCGG